MSEMRDLMLRSLDRIVEDTLDVAARVAADGGADWPQKLWSALDEQGMTAIGETADGDLGFGDVMALVQRSAYHAVPVPLGETVIARRLLGRAGLAIPDGPLSVAAPSACSGVSLANGRLAGRAGAVAWGGKAGGILLGTGNELVLADASGAVVGRSFSMAGEPRDDIDLTKAKVLASAPLAGAAGVVEAEGALLRAVQMSGALARVLDHCLTWANDRVQFGKPIAKFQAIQHMLAQLAAESAAAGAAADLAIEASTLVPDRFAIGVAKARTGEAAGKGAAIAHQAFGAMGFTREHPLHYATRRLWSWRDEFGSETYWQAEIGRSVAARGADRLWATLTGTA
ncbi:MAG: acyl-CoA dehydrogenase family protein [Bacteroidota bacterium]